MFMNTIYTIKLIHADMTNIQYFQHYSSCLVYRSRDNVFFIHSWLFIDYFLRLFHWYSNL